MKKFIFYLLLLLVGFEGLGQWCGTPQIKNSTKESYVKYIDKKYKNLRPSTQTIYVPLRVFFLKTANEAAPVDQTILNEQIAYSNDLYRALNIQFYISGASTHELSNTLLDFSNFDYDKSKDIYNAIHTTNSINLYITNQLDNSGNTHGLTFLDWQQDLNNIEAFNVASTNVIFMIKNALPKTLAHELGHYFGLYHTFTEGVEESSCILEDINGDNIHADFISDTPSDPFKFLITSDYNVSEACVLTLNNPNKNICGRQLSNFTPPINNLMSYYRKSNGGYCSSELSQLQMNRILNGSTFRFNGQNGYILNESPSVTIKPTLIAEKKQTGVMLNWNEIAGATGYFLEKKLPNGEFYTLKSFTSSEFVYFDLNGIVGSTYKIRASNAIIFSDEVYATLREAGITVLTHGFQFTGSMSGDWTKYANAVRNRFSTEIGTNKGATILINNPKGNWTYLDNGGNGNGIFNPNNEEVIFLFDWAASSNNSLSNAETGYLEHSADVLYAMLVNPVLELPDGSTLNLNESQPAQFITQKQTHFIGHSRGTILLLQTLYRLKNSFPSYDLERLTLLDPHPAGYFGDVKRDNVTESVGNLPGVGGAATNCLSIFCYAGNQSVYLTVPDNVLKVEDYYRQDPDYYEPIGSFNNGINAFSGVPLIGGNNSYLMDNNTMKAGVSNLPGILGGAHGAVPEWYFKTIDLTWELSNSENEYWYKGFEGDFMVSKNRLSAGYNQTLPTIPIIASISDYNETYNLRTNKSQLEKIFGGDFEYASAAGWHYINNDVNRKPNIHFSEKWLQLFPFTNDIEFKTSYAKHNTMYFPSNLLSIAMDVKIDLGSYTGQTMPLLIVEFYNNESTKIKQYFKSFINTTFNRIQFDVPTELLGKNGTFRLLFGDNGENNQYDTNNLKMIIDNIELENEIYKTGITNIEYFLDSIDPGLGLATPVSFTNNPDNTDVNASLNLNVGQITAGNHTINFRAKNSEGQWSNVNFAPFEVLAATVVSGSIYIDLGGNTPAQTTGAYISLIQGTTIIQTVPVNGSTYNFPPLADGTYRIVMHTTAAGSLTPALPSGFTAWLQEGGTGTAGDGMPNGIVEFVLANGGLTYNMARVAALGNISFVLQPSGPLPVRLISFEGKALEIGNELNWKTSQELNFSHYEIEKSIDAKAFNFIGKVNGVNNSKENLTYSYLDVISASVMVAGANSSNQPIAQGNYYRLKMVDLDGKFNYSNIIYLQKENNKSLVGEFYPNPVKDGHATIQIYSKEIETWFINSYDELGRVLVKEIWPLNKGNNTMKLGTTKLANGVNLIRFESSDGMVVRKLVVR